MINPFSNFLLFDNKDNIVRSNLPQVNKPITIITAAYY